MWLLVDAPVLLRAFDVSVVSANVAKIISAVMGVVKLAIYA